MNSQEIVNQLRSAGWMVCSHNDYPYQGVNCTYWSFSKGNQFISGNGVDDVEALNWCLKELRDNEKI